MMTWKQQIPLVLKEESTNLVGILDTFSHFSGLKLLLGMFYWVLLNLHPAHRSTLHSIQLLAVVKSSDIRVYGIDAVFAPLIADLTTLAKDVST